MDIKKLRPWLLPLVWLLGFVCAWGMILVDRQMMIDSQAELRKELRRTKRQLQVVAAADEFGDMWQKIVIWNKEAIIEEEEMKRDLINGFYYYCYSCQEFGNKVKYDGQFIIAKLCSCGQWYKYKKKKLVEEVPSG